MKDSYMFYTDKLGGEYKAVFERIEMYVQSRNIDEDMKEERLGELLDIFLSAAETGKPVRRITGNDLEQFCKTFCSDFGMKNRILFLLDWFKSIAKVLVIVSVLDLVFPETDAASGGNTGFWDSLSSLNLSGYFLGIVIAGIFAWAVNLALRRMMFRQKCVSMKILKAVSAAAAVSGFLIVWFFLSRNRKGLFSCPAWIVLSVSGAYLFLHYLLRGRHIRREKVKFFDLVQEESNGEFAKEMEKKFEKAKKRSLKKGKGELSLEEFLDKEEKDCDQTEKMGFIYYILPVAVTGGDFLLSYFTDGIESISDATAQAVLILAVQYPIMLGLFKIIKIGVAQRREWIRKKRNEAD